MEKIDHFESWKEVKTRNIDMLWSCCTFLQEDCILSQGHNPELLIYSVNYYMYHYLHWLALCYKYFFLNDCHGIFKPIIFWHHTHVYFHETYHFNLIYIHNYMYHNKYILEGKQIPWLWMKYISDIPVEYHELFPQKI